MRWVQRLVPWTFMLWTAGAAAQDSLTVNGDIDVRWVQASGVTSFLNGGLGLLRFDPDHEGIRLGRAFLAPNWRATDIVSVHAVIDAYDDYHERNAVDVSEFYVDVRPFPTGPIRWAHAWARSTCRCRSRTAASAGPAFIRSHLPR